MANVSPFLQMLLNRKKNDPSIYTPDTVDPNLPLEGQGPTIALRPKPSMLATDTATAPNDIDKIAALGTLPQQPTVPIAPMVAGAAPNVVPTATIPLGPRPAFNRPYAPFEGNDVAGQTSIPLPPRDVIQEDRDRLTAAQAKHPSLGRRILEGLGTYAASGIGLNLRPILHPGGTEEEKARRQLATDLGIQKAQTENQDTQTTIALRSAQARKIDADLNNPDTSDADKAKLEVAKEILRSHPQGFDPNDPADVVAKKKLEDAGVPIPANYGKQPKAAGPPETRTRMDKGVKYQTEFDPETRKFVYSTDASGDRIVVDEAPAEKPDVPPEVPETVPDTTAPWIQKEQEHRTLAANAKKSAEDAEASLEQWQANNKDKKPGEDVNAARAMANAERFRKTETEENKNANEAYNKRLEAAAGDAKKKAEVEAKAKNANAKISARKPKPGTPSPTTHILSKKAWLGSHPATDWPKAITAAKVAGYQVVE